MNHPKVDHNECVKVCNGLLRIERSAVETYEMAIEKFAGEAEADLFQEIYGEHCQATIQLQEYVLSLNGTPDKKTGMWGNFANVVKSSANLFGENSVIAALKEGEELVLALYRDALHNQKVSSDCKDIMRRGLINATERHIDSLGQLSDENK